MDILTTLKKEQKMKSIVDGAKRRLTAVIAQRRHETHAKNHVPVKSFRQVLAK